MILKYGLMVALLIIAATEAFGWSELTYDIYGKPIHGNVASPATNDLLQWNGSFWINVPATSIVSTQMAIQSGGVAQGNATTLNAGSGLSAAISAGVATFTNTGVTSAVAGTAISISGATGAVTINNIGVTSNVAGSGISVNAATGAVTITNTGALSVTGSGSISASPTTGNVVISASYGSPGSVGTSNADGSATTFARSDHQHQGVHAAVAGAGIGVSAANGDVTFSNTGVTSAVAGTAISLSGGTGAVTINNIGVTSAVAGAGISVSAATGAVTITNGGVTSATGSSDISVSASTGAVSWALTAGTIAKLNPAPGAGASAIRIVYDNNSTYSATASTTTQYQVPQVGAGSTSVVWGLVTESNITAATITTASLAASVTARLTPTPGAAANVFRLIYDTNSTNTAMSSSSAAYQVPFVNSAQTAIAWGLLTTNNLSASAGITGGQIASGTIAESNITAATITTASLAASVTGRLNPTPGAASGAVRIVYDNSSTYSATASSTTQYQVPQVGAGATSVTWGLITESNITAATITTASLAATVTARLNPTPAAAANVFRLVYDTASAYAAMSSSSAAYQVPFVKSDQTAVVWGLLTTSNLSASAGITGGQIASGTIAESNITAATITTASLATAVTNRLLPTSPTTGDIVYYNSGWQKLPIGAVGDKLTVAGSPALPSWSAGGASISAKTNGGTASTVDTVNFIVTPTEAVSVSGTTVNVTLDSVAAAFTFTGLRIRAHASSTTLNVTIDAATATASSGAQYKYTSIACDPSISTAGPAINGRDQAGAFSASSWVYLWLVCGYGKTPGAMFSTSSTAVAGYPAGYNQSSLIGCARLNGSTQFVPFLQSNRYWAYAAVQTVVNFTAAGADTAYTSSDLAAYAPPIACSALYWMQVRDAVTSAPPIDFRLSWDGANDVYVAQNQVHQAYLLNGATTIPFKDLSSSSARTLYYKQGQTSVGGGDIIIYMQGFTINI